MRFIASVIYFLLKLVVALTNRIFYSNITILNRNWLKFKNPAIVVSNHPSTLLDPLNTAVRVSKQVSFLANAGLFKNPIANAILNLYCIPIERPKDVGGRKIQNSKNFARADQHLAKDRCIYIAPEGTSVVERRIRTVKTGTARIALSAAGKNDFQLGVTIVPVGLNYTASQKFQSELLLNVGEPIEVRNYRSLYEENPFNAARKITADLQEKMEQLILNTDGELQDQLLSYFEITLQSDRPLAPADKFKRAKKVLEQLRLLTPAALKKQKQKGDKYFDLLEKERLNDLAVSRIINQRSSLVDVLKLIFGLPFFLYGWINNFLAFYIPGLLARKLKLYHGYQSTVKVLSGLIIIPLLYFIQTRTIVHFFDLPYIGWIYILSLLPMGWLAWQYRGMALQFFKDQKARQLKKKKPALFDEIESLRSEFSAPLNEVEKTGFQAYR